MNIYDDEPLMNCGRCGEPMYCGELVYEDEYCADCGREVALEEFGQALRRLEPPDYGAEMADFIYKERRGG